MSVFLEDGITFDGKTPDEVLKLDKWLAYFLCEFTAGYLRRDLGQLIERSPIECFPGHGNLIHPGGPNRPGGVRTKMAKNCLWTPGCGPNDRA